MDPPTLPMFSSITAECEYWKLRSQKYLKELMEVKKEYDEFIEESHGIETEMDATLEQRMKKIKELTNKAVINEKEKEVLMARLNSQSSEMSTMARELASVTHKFDSMKVDLRILEQSNDRLEQAERIANESKETVENLLFEQYEKIALLEEEVEEKRVLEEELQRLRDEARDLRHELSLQPKPAISFTVASQVGDDCLESLNRVKQRKANLRRVAVASLRARDPKQELQPACSGVAVDSQVHGGGDSLESVKAVEQLEVVSVSSNLQYLIRKTVGDMVTKLDNLQAKLRAHRERRPLPRPSPSA